VSGGMMKKKISVFLLIVLITSLMIGIGKDEVYGDIEIRNIEVLPNVVDSVAQYNIYIVLHKDVNRGENLYIKFPSNYILPQSINKEFVEVAGYKPSSISITGNTVVLTLSEPILQNQGAGTGGILVTFSSSAGIKNPSSPDIYSIEVWSTAEPDHSIYYFYIGTQSQGSTIKEISVILSDNGAGKVSQYDIVFTVSSSGALLPGDYVDFFFPKGTVLPSTPDPSEVLLNIANCSTVSVQERRVRVYVPEGRYIAPGARVNIIFLKEFGIVNPELTGNFAIQIATSKDTGLVTSNFYTLYGTSITSLSASVFPSSQKMSAEYTFQFKTSKVTGKLSHGTSKINIKFAAAFVMPQFVKPGAITINGVPCTNVNISDNTLVLFTPVDILDDTLVAIVVKKDFGIVNPETIGSYEVFVNTSADAIYVSTNLSITPSTISQPQVTLSNTSAGQVSAYTISFSTGISGNLVPGIDRINVVLPVGTTIPSIIANSSILVNEVPTTLVEISGTTLTITIPIEIKANSVVKLSILESAGLRNPVQSGDYKLYIFTTKEQTSIASNAFSIQNVPQTTIKINPINPDGQSGFYKTKPTIILSSVSATDLNPTIYYYFDNNSPAVYSGAITIPEGIHTLYYYAVDKEGHKEEARFLQIKVDTLPPVIAIISPQDNSVLSNKIVTIKGYVDPGSTILVDRKSVVVDGMGNFETSIEIGTSPQTVNIVATDIAGNTYQKTMTFYLDLNPPPLAITKPIMFQQINKLPLLVEGTSEKGAKVTVNGITAQVKDDGSFSFSLADLPEGEVSNIEIVATDPAGNSAKKIVSVKYSKTTVIKLQVGNKVALINDTTYTLEATPTIVNGRTVVPLRFIGEAFGATFDYDSIFKIVNINFNGQEIKMQIGMKTAFVNGKATSLDVAPYIVNGRTLVPIRFISEVFGSYVTWDGTTKTVTIIYPK
jgi:hypothetical protein